MSGIGEVLLPVHLGAPSGRQGETGGRGADGGLRPVGPGLEGRTLCRAQRLAGPLHPEKSPGGITDDEKQELENIVLETIETPEWGEAIKRYNWNENVITGDELTQFIKDETERITALYKELGL